MPLNVAINGFGRIGRLVCRIASEIDDVNIVAINDLVPSENLAYLLQYDTTHGTFSQNVEVEGNSLLIGGKKTLVFSQKDPSQLPWKELGVDYVIESTGLFLDPESAKKHIEAGAERVIISAPAKGNVPTFVMGVNQEAYNPSTDLIVSNASCTTNCLAPITKVLLDHFGIEEGLMSTVHAMTATQSTVDSPSAKDLRAGRGASQNVIPSSTGAAKAVGLCIPEVEGKLTGMAFRVPIANVSVVDLTVRLGRDTTYDEICHAMKEASKTSMTGILAYCDRPLVSSDFIGWRHSSIFDRDAGIALNPRFFKIISWYDNEMGYSARLVDLARYMKSREPARAALV